MSVLHGLVVCGGQSTRMGMDKSQLQYHGVPQREWLYELLQPLCEDVYISCNAEQAAEIGDSYPTITDATIYRNIGPVSYTHLDVYKRQEQSHVCSATHIGGTVTDIRYSSTVYEMVYATVDKQQPQQTRRAAATYTGYDAADAQLYTPCISAGFSAIQGLPQIHWFSFYTDSSKLAGQWRITTSTY